MSKPPEHLFDSAAALNEALADALCERLTRAVEHRGVASLVVSGGSTPRPLFDTLAQRPAPWPKIWVTLADERWVETNAPESNEALVRHHLLKGPAGAARFVGMKNSATTAEIGQTRCERALAEVPRPFDAVVLGMGEDGHTASLFPGAAELAEGLADSDRLCLAVNPPNGPPARISLTLSALLRSRSVVLHIVGERKRAVYRRAVERGPIEELPIRGVLANSSVEVFWAP